VSLDGRTYVRLRPGNAGLSTLSSELAAGLYLPADSLARLIGREPKLNFESGISGQARVIGGMNREIHGHRAIVMFLSLREQAVGWSDIMQISFSI